MFALSTFISMIVYTYLGFVVKHVCNLNFYAQILKVQNRLLKVCYVPATSASLSRLLFLRWPLTVLMKQTRQAVHAFKQSILLKCLCLHATIFMVAYTYLGLVVQQGSS
jgi:hypothetical protein